MGVGQNASPGQPPHYLVRNNTPEPLTGICKLEGSPAVPAELASIRDTVNELIDEAESVETKLNTNPLFIIKVNADGTYTTGIGDGEITSIDASTPGVYVLTYVGSKTVNNAFANAYASDSYAQAVSISAPSGGAQGINVHVRTGGVLTQKQFSVAFYQ